MLCPSLQALLSTNSVPDRTLQAVLATEQRLLAVGWLSPPLGALHLALLHRVQQHGPPAPLRPLALRCIALLHAAVLHRTGIGVEVRLAPVAGVRGAGAIATRTSRAVPCGSFPAPLALGPARVRVPAMSSAAAFDLRITWYPRGLHPAPQPHAAGGGALSLRWAAVQGPARGGPLGAQALGSAAEVEYCLPAEDPGAGRVACAYYGAEDGAWREAGPPDPPTEGALSAVVWARDGGGAGECGLGS